MDIEAEIERIDGALKAAGIPPHQRPIRAVVEFGKKFKLSMPIAGGESGASGEVGKNWIFSQRIYDWYRDVYGERSKVDPSEHSRIAVLVDGDLWEVRIPLFFGTAFIVPSRVLGTNEDRIGRRPLPINPLEAMVGITQQRASRFSDADVEECVKQYLIGFDVRSAFDRCLQRSSYFAESRNDLLTSVVHLTNRSPSYGQARWSTLQFVEKFCKDVMDSLGMSIPKKGHDIEAIISPLLGTALPAQLESDVKSVQCPAGVRYGEIASSREEAYQAHKGGLRIIKLISEKHIS